MAFYLGTQVVTCELPYGVSIRSENFPVRRVRTLGWSLGRGAGPGQQGAAERTPAQRRALQQEDWRPGAIRVKLLRSLAGSAC